MTTFFRGRGTYGLLASCLLLIPTVAPCGTIVQSARAAGMGVAFIAIADDASAVSFNPAGLSQLNGTQYYGGLAALSLSTEFESREGFAEATDDVVYLAPHAYLATDFGSENFGFGIGIYSPLGIGGRNWSETGLMRYISTENSVATIDISAAAGWAIIPDRLAVGGSLVYMLSRNVAKQMVDQSAQGAGDGKFEYDGQGGGTGFTLSLLARPFDGFRIGLNYRSRISITHEGDIELTGIAPGLQSLFGGDTYRTDARNTQEMPQILGVGFAFTPTDALTLGMDFQKVEWSVFDKVTLNIKNEVPSAGLSDVTTNLNWHDAWVISVGGEYRLNDRWTLRAGYFFTESPVPTQTLNPAAPEADSHTLNLSIGYKTTKLALDAAYTLQLPAEITVGPQVLEGSYRNTIHSAVLSIGYLF